MKYISPGALHIHTNYSDGTESVEKIASAAKKAGLEWIIITDHNSLKALEIDGEGWYNGVAVLIGEEITPPNSDHYLALNIDKEISPDQNPEKYMDEVKKQGGIGFIAHPDESLCRKNKHRPLRWANWNITGFDGIEIWNHLSDWVDNYDPKKAAYCYLRRNDILQGPSQNVLKWWDRVNFQNDNIIPAIGGLDVHSLNYKFLGLNIKVFPYLDSFKTVTNNLHLDQKLSEDFNLAKEQILSSLKNGKNNIVNRVWNSQKENFNFYIENCNSRSYPGESLILDDVTKIVIKIQKTAKFRLIYNGELVEESIGKELICNDVRAGKYRVEVFYKNHPWIFTNPIIVSS